MSEAERLADELDDTPNWQKEKWGSQWKHSTMTYSRVPFEAAAELRRLSAELAALKAAIGKPVAWMMQWPNHSPSFTTDKSDYASWFAEKVSYPDGLVSLYAIPKDKP